MERNGKIDDFNEVTNTGERVTSENFNQYAEQQLAASKERRLNNPHVLNTISVVLPEYSGSPRAINDVVAEVKMEDGSMWATYKYRGITQYRGSPAYVLDLERVPEGTQDKVVMGFDVVDSKSMLPLLLVLDAGTNSHLEQVSCSQ